MSMLEAIIDRYEGEEFLKADGFDDAIIGVDPESMRLIYSVSKSLEVLRAQGMDELDALEYFDFNVRGSFMGKKTPIWCDDEYELPDVISDKTKTYWIEKIIKWIDQSDLAPPQKDECRAVINCFRIG